MQKIHGELVKGKFYEDLRYPKKDAKERSNAVYRALKEKDGEKEEDIKDYLGEKNLDRFGDIYTYEVSIFGKTVCFG